MSRKNQHFIGRIRGESTRKKGKKCEGEEIPVQAWIGPEFSRRLRLPYFKKFGT